MYTFLNQNKSIYPTIVSIVWTLVNSLHGPLEFEIGSSVIYVWFN